jgi:predicted amidohydrolase YtcJ
VRALAGEDTRILDAGGRTVTPGFFDAHAHVSGNSRPVAGVDLAYVADKDEWLRRLAEADDRMPAGEWITGGGWDHTLSDGAFPTRRMLDGVVPDRPVFLTHIDGHYAWVNSRALEVAGVTAQTPVPAGGEIVLDDAGEPLGILLEGAMGVVRSAIPERTDAQRREGLAAMQRYANRLGVTGLHQIGGLEDYLHLVEAGDATLRIWYGQWGPDGDPAEDSEAIGAIVDRQGAVAERVAATGREAERGPLLALGFVKLMNDGVLSAHTAVLLEDYADRPGWRGEYIVEPDVLAARVRRLAAAGLPVAIHSIGDAAVRASLDAFEGAQELPVPHPHRIEHIELLHPDDLPRFAELGVVASMQPNHATNAIGYVPERVGEARAANAYVWRALLEDGATLVFSADYGTSPLSPLTQIADAVFRTSPFGFNDGTPWHPEQAVTFEQALHAYTQASADITAWGDQLGSVTVGKWADFVVLDGRVPEPVDESFRDLAVAHTCLAGREVYAAEE